MTKINRKINLHVTIPDQIKFIDPEKTYLDNGIPVYLVRSGTQDLVKIDLIYNAGSKYSKKVLLPIFTNKLLVEGTASKSSHQISEMIDFYGAHIDPTISKDNAYLSLYSLNKHLPEMIPLLAEIIHQPALNNDELEIMKRNLKQDFIIDVEKVKYQARRKFNEIIFGSAHPYGRLYEVDDFDHVEQKEVVDFHQQMYIGNNLKILVSGKIPDNLMPLLNKYLGFGTLSKNGINPKPLQAISKPDKLDHVIENKNALQSAIRIGKSTFNKTHTDYAGFKVLNTIFGGYFGSRLMTNIREDKGYTYGIGSAIISLQDCGYFFIASEVGSEVTQKAIKEIRFEIDRLKQDLVKDEELHLVKNYMLGSLMRSVDSVFTLSETIKNLIEYDLDSNYQYQFIETIKDISAKEIRDLAQQFFVDEEMVKLIVGN
jgi:predicted Zn-dependent peptidase